MSSRHQRTLRLAAFVGAHALFWGWNLLFLCVIAFGLGPVLLFETLQAAWMGLVPWSIGVFVPILIAIPVFGMVAGGWLFRRDGGRLLSLFFGVQFPLMALVLVRIFGIGELVPSTTVLLGAFFVGTVCQLQTLIRGFSETRHSAQALRLIGQSVYLGMGLWIGAILGLFLVPVAVELGSELMRWPLYRRSLGEALYHLPFLAFGLVTVAVFLSFPVAMVGITLRSWQVVHRASAQKFGRLASWACTLGTLVGLTVATGVTSIQPQHRALALLNAATDDAGRREAIAAQEAIRVGLLNARLNRYRYLGSYADEPVSSLYRRSVGAWSEVPAVWLWKVVAWPVTYHPVEGGRPWAERQMALDRYRAFFDVPMDRAERETILDTMRTTWNWRQAAAGLLDIGERRVWLESQDIVVEPHGDHATVTIHDVYRNRTWQNEEVLVSFSLPEGAVVTGLWLGATDDRSEAFTHVVAPRGAAQEVYERQVRRSVDPALLEQVGPRQVRLRAFPVLPRSGGEDDLAAMAEDGPPLHVWIQIDVWSEDGGWPLPRSTEVRNLFWDRHTAWTVNGTAVSKLDDWTPRFVADEAARARPPAQYPFDSSGQHIGVFVDTSRSMADVGEELAAAIATLEGVDHRITWLNLEDRTDLLLWGTLSLENELWRLPTAGLDAVVVLTDGSAYDITEGRGQPYQGPPLWMVHLGGLPHSYADVVLDGITASRGGVGVSVSEVLGRIGNGPPVHAEVLDADPSATRLLIAGRLASHLRAGGSLDDVHALAVEHDLVTPWSSMIVLVNDDQLRQLDEASQREDRFEREAIDDDGSGFDQLTATPEPHEWALMAIASLMLGLKRRKRRTDGSGSPAGG